jgi:hypothetical protein
LLVDEIRNSQQSSDQYKNGEDSVEALSAFRPKDRRDACPPRARSVPPLRGGRPSGYKEPDTTPQRGVGPASTDLPPNAKSQDFAVVKYEATAQTSS